MPDLQQDKELRMLHGPLEKEYQCPKCKAIFLELHAEKLHAALCKRDKKSFDDGG